MQMEGQRKIKEWHSCKELLFALEHDYTRSLTNMDKKTSSLPLNN